MYKQSYLFFALLVSYSHLAPDGISDFLEDQSLQHLAPAFILEEIEVRQIPSIPDNYLVELGVRTMGARLRLRSAAAAWLDQSRSQGSQDQAQSTTSATSTPTIPATSSFSSDPAQSTTSATSSDQAQDPDHLRDECNTKKTFQLGLSLNWGGGFTLARIFLRPFFT